MDHNLELKAAIRSVEGAMRVAESIGAFFEGVMHQIDTYFIVSTGRLKLRETTGTLAELISYDREESTDERWSYYHRLPVTDSAGLKVMLRRSLGVEETVSKRRTLFLYGITRIHIDEVDELGSFVEFEAVNGDPRKSQLAIAFLKDAFSIRQHDIIRGSYVDLISKR